MGQSNSREYQLSKMRRRRYRRRRRQRGGINPLVLKGIGRVAKKGLKGGLKYGLPILAPYLANKGINLMNKKLKTW